MATRAEVGGRRPLYLGGAVFGLLFSFFWLKAGPGRAETGRGREEAGRLRR